MSSNFEFLKSIKDTDYLKICGGLYEACVSAEEMASRFPDTSITQSRKAGELVTKLVYVKCVSQRLQKDDGTYKTVFELQTDPNFESALAKMFGEFEAQEILNDLHTIRKYGNTGAHDGNTDAVATANGILRKVQLRVPQLIKKLGLMSSADGNGNQEFTEKVRRIFEKIQRELDAKDQLKPAPKSQTASPVPKQPAMKPPTPSAQRPQITEEIKRVQELAKLQKRQRELEAEMKRRGLL